MKTKKFIERLNLFSDGRDCYVKESEAQISLIDPGGRLILVAHKYHQYILDVNHLPFHHMTKNTKEELFQLVVEYAKTPTEEREEEKKYRYKFPFRLAVTEIEKEAHLRREELRKNLRFIVVDTSGVDFAKKYSDFHFTDKEVEQYQGKERALFNACEKIEVTSND